jgi:N-methylhydantoinase A
VSPEFREYERTATTVANAYLGPRMARYVSRFAGALREVLPDARVLIMQSNGGTAAAGAVVRVPVRTLMSGPVAGVVASKFLGDQVGLRDLLTIDVGGTSCDMAVLPGELAYTTQSTVGGHVIRTPSVDIHTIGSGGGSIAWLGPGRVLKVGPQSAGAEPGPACYARGATLPTLTDALLVLGYLGERSFLGGRMAIHTAPARQAIATHIAEPLGMDVERAAAGIVRVLANQVALAMRSITIERGHDPREFNLVAFGGAGPTLAAHLARELGIPRVVVPPDPGNYCAFGMLVSDLRHDVVQTRIGRLDELADAEALDCFDALAAECARELAAQGATADEIGLERYCDMRYLGQSYEVLVPLAGPAGTLDREALLAEFHRLHERRYGHKAPGEPVEMVAFRVRGIGSSARPRLAPEAPAAGPPPAPVDERAVLFDPAAGPVPTPVYRRDALAPGLRLAGPCIVEESSSTTIVVPDAHLAVDGFRNLILTLGTERA